MFRFLRHAFDAVKMIRTRGSSAILLILLLGAHSAAAVASQHVSLSKDLLTSNGTRAVYAMLAGVPHWRLLPHLWVDKTVSLRWNHGKVGADFFPRVSLRICVLSGTIAICMSRIPKGMTEKPVWTAQVLSLQDLRVLCLWAGRCCLCGARPGGA